MHDVYRDLMGRDLDGIVHNIRTAVHIDGVHLTGCGECFRWIGQRLYTDLKVLFKVTELATCLMCLAN